MERFSAPVRAQFRALLLISAAFLIPTIAPRAQQPLYAVVSAPLAVDQKTAIPGHVLNPGDYSIRIIDRLKDRYILQVEDAEGKALSTFIGLHNPDFAPFVILKHQGPIFWTAAPKGQKAMRGFSFANGNTLELVYPKAEAVTLAKLNTNSVPAIDPESEGRKPDPKLTPEDREVVTLWMLSATRVSPQKEIPAIEAKRFVPATEGVETARAGSAEPSTASSASSQARQDRAAPVRVATAEVPPRIRSSVKRLPQTASELPLLLVFALLALFMAAGLRIGRNAA